MKKIIILMMILLVGLTACTKDMLKSSDEAEKPCTREYVPLCCNRITYPNQCYADNAKAENCVEGQCPEEECVPDEKICTDDYDPYCCNNKTYSNYCNAMNACATNCIKGEC